MTTRLLAGLLALPLLLADARPAAADGLPCPNFGCGGFCMNLFGRFHQHGPLFNYGPYYGYYPFEPYGPWTSDLRYNPPMNCGRCGLFHRGDCGGGLFDRDGCGGWGHYAKSTLKNIFHRTHPGSHKCGNGNCASATTAVGCSSCAAPATPIAAVPPPAPIGATDLLVGTKK